MTANFEAIYNEAKNAAVEAIKNSQYPEQFGACGFAWVRIKPATSPFVKWLKAQAAATNDRQYGRKDEYAGGWTIWNAGGYVGQRVDTKELACQAFAAVLVKYGINAWDESRLD